METVLINDDAVIFQLWNG